MTEITRNRQHEEINRGMNQTREQRRTETTETVVEQNVQGPLSEADRAETAQLEAKLAQVQKDFEEFNRRLERGEKVAGNKEEQFQHYQRESRRLAEEIANQRAKSNKSEQKKIHKLEKAEAEAMRLANELAERQAAKRESEQQKINMVAQTEAEARKLALEMVQKHEQDRQFAESKVKELCEAETNARKKIKELEGHQQQLQKQLHIHQTEVTHTEQNAREELEKLTEEQEKERREVNQLARELQQIQAELKLSNELALKHARDLEEARRRQQELARLESEAKNRAQSLSGKQQEEEQRIHELAQEMANRESELENAQYRLQHELEVKRSSDVHVTEMIHEDREALKKSKELVDRLGRERQNMEQKLRQLREDEVEAKRKLEQLGGTQLVQTSEPATVDVYQHTRYQTNEPGIEVQPAAQPEEDKSLVEKIGDGIKKLF